MDQWHSKFSESFSLDRYWSIECSSLVWHLFWNSRGTSCSLSSSSIPWFLMFIFLMDMRLSHFHDKFMFLGSWVVRASRWIRHFQAESDTFMGLLFATPTPTYKAIIWTKLWPPNCRISLVLKHLGSYFVQMFVHIFALYVSEKD